MSRRRKRLTAAPLLTAILALAAALALAAPACRAGGRESAARPAAVAASSDSLPQADSLSRYTELTEADFQRVGRELGIETAAIKAVVEIEAGRQMKGFYAPGVPVVNFDRTMFNKYRRQKKGSPMKGATVPKGLKGYALSEWTQLTNARHIDNRAACLGTFWGMFQIGGFNYKTCGCEGIEEFVERMSASELEQLELFAAFIANSGMLEDLRRKNWAGFARKFNGPSYARRGYHTKMANAYSRYRQKEKESAK